MIIAGYADLSHQFTANSPQEAMEWVEQIKIVLRGKQTFLYKKNFPFLLYVQFHLKSFVASPNVSPFFVSPRLNQRLKDRGCHMFG